MPDISTKKRNETTGCMSVIVAAPILGLAVVLTFTLF